MKSKEMQNLFGEPLVNECETRVVKNKTLAFKKKSKATQEYHYIPINNIKNRKPTKQFLNEMLEISKAGEYEIHQILYAIGQELTGGKQLPDFHQKSKSNLKISIPDAVRKEHDLIGDCYQYLTNKYERLKKGTFYTTEKIIESIVKNIEINENTSVFDPACGSGNLILNSKVKNPLQVHGLDIDPLAVMCCQFNYYLKFGNDAPTPDIRCGNFVDFVKQSRANNLKFDVILCNPPYGAEMEIKETYGSEIRSIDCLDYFVEHASQMAETSVFVLPETVINVKKHESLRSWILKKKKLAAVQSFGLGIRATIRELVALTLNKNNNNFFIFDGKKVGYDFTIKMLDGKFRPIDQNDINFINKIYAVRHQTLGKCKHVTGIVTGDDDKFLMDMKSDDNEPIITGKNVEPYRITGEKYIKYEEVKGLLKYNPKYSFRTDEKLIYHTISRSLEFAIDYDRRLTTNNANFFLVEDFGVSAKCIMAILNSKIYNRLNKLLFGDKVNRIGNIKKLPIPILTDAQQRKIEQCVDEERYEDIERFLEEFFRI